MNPAFNLRSNVWNRWVGQSQSWIGLDRVAREAETHYFVNGIYPSTIDEIAAGVDGDVPVDPWGRPYRLVTRGGKLLVTGLGPDGESLPNLILSRSLAWEGNLDRFERPQGPGVQLLD